MSQTPDYAVNAEKLFEDAFERLKRDQPVTLPRGTPVSQNNVAKEAGRDPSALRKSRYPTLIRSIQSWIQENGDAPRNRASSASLIKGARDRNRELNERLKEITKQRDTALSRLVIAEEAILGLHQRMEVYKARLGELDNVVQLQTGAARGG